VTPRARLLFWDYARGSMAYDLMLVLLFVIVFAVPAAFWRDPMVAFR
jgi:hypothetical protein